MCGNAEFSIDVKGDAQVVVCYEQVEEMNIKGLVIGYPLELTGFQGKQVGCLPFSPQKV